MEKECLVGSEKNERKIRSERDGGECSGDREGKSNETGRAE